MYDFELIVIPRKVFCEVLVALEHIERNLDCPKTNSDLGILQLLVWISMNMFSNKPDNIITLSTLLGKKPSGSTGKEEWQRQVESITYNQSETKVIRM